MNPLLVAAFLALALCILACLWLIKRFADQAGTSQLVIRDLLQQLNESRLPGAEQQLTAAPVDDEADASMKALADTFYADMVAAVFNTADDMDADGSYPPPTPEELAEAEASVANEQFQPPLV